MSTVEEKYEKIKNENMYGNENNRCCNNNVVERKKLKSYRR